MVTETFELDCSYCDNLIHVSEELPSSNEPVIVKNYYFCKANVFQIAFTKEELKKYYLNCTTRIELTRHKFVDELISEIDTVNIIIAQLLGERKVDVVKIDAHLAAGLASPCITQLDFFMKIDFLYNILDFDREPLRKLLKTVKPEWKGVTLLKQLLAENDQPDNGAIAFFEKIIFIRNKTYPAHRFDQEVINVLREIGLQYPVSSEKDWQKNWDMILRRFTDSFRYIRRSLTNIAKIKTVNK
jgi:hypothetical protein